MPSSLAALHLSFHFLMYVVCCYYSVDYEGKIVVRSDADIFSTPNFANLGGRVLLRCIGNH